VTGQPYEIDLTRTARRALAERLPLEVVIGASEFINGPLADNPQRVGKELDKPYHGVYSARVMQEWRVLYVIDETQHRVTIRDISHRRDTYRAH
jgi:mRNA interferase RelE/StbE